MIEQSNTENAYSILSYQYFFFKNLVLKIILPKRMLKKESSYVRHHSISFHQLQVAVGFLQKSFVRCVFIYRGVIENKAMKK